MTRPEERLNHPVSRAELERRWSELRLEMEREGLDVLVAQNNNDHVGGVVRYLTDIPATNGYPVTVILPRDGPMTLIRHGRRGEDLAIDPDHDPVLRGVGRALARPYMTSAPYTRTHDAELAVEVLRPFTRGTVGLVGTSAIPMAFGEHLRRELTEARFVEAADVVNRVRAVKSAEELDCVRAAAALQDAAMAAALAEVRPGRRDSEIAAIAQHTAQDLGSEQGIYWCASVPPGEPARVAHPHSQHRVMGEGDLFYLMIEVNGPGGMYTELGRIASIGPVPARLAEEHEFCLEAQRFCLGLLRPGTPATQVWADYNTFLRAHGRPAEDRLHCHSQGTDLVEPPLIREDEPMPILGGMNLACHPRWVVDGFCVWTCDNVVVHDDATIERVHAADPRILDVS